MRSIVVAFNTSLRIFGSEAVSSYVIAFFDYYDPFAQVRAILSAMVAPKNPEPTIRYLR